jgi:hypothetical protein
MKEVKIDYPKKERFNLNISTIKNKCNCIIIYINLMLIIYLIIQNYTNKKFARDYLNKLYNEEKKRESNFDKDMIGLNYPEINFNEIKKNYLDGNSASSILEFLNQLEIKLIFLEKEINVTKLVSFFTMRKIYLKNNNVTYDDSKITEYHDIINWLIIHKSTQLKGIAADKYLACKYAKMKLGINLCPHRIGVYNNVEEIDFEKLIKMGNVILKISNGNQDNIFITNKTTLDDIETIKKKTIFHFNRNYPLHVPSLHHLYSKKRIILEKMFIPMTDLYEFKILIFNKDIKLILIRYKYKNGMTTNYYYENFIPVFNTTLEKKLISNLKRNLLNKMKDYSLKLAEDFPNFIRVDLYIFHDKIYLSELTFDSHAGLPTFLNVNFFNDYMKKWKRVDF